MDEETEMNEEQTAVPEVTNEVVAETVAPVESGAPETTEEAAPETPPPEATVSQEEFNKIYFQMKQAERDLAAATQTPAPEVAPVDQDELTLEQFDYDDEAFTKASIERQVQDQVKAALATQHDVEAQAAANTKAMEITTGFNNKAAAYAALNPEYQKAINNAVGVVFPTHVQEVILGSEFGPQIDHMLLSDAVLMERISSLAPTQAIMELGRMEQQFTKAPVKQKSVSSAPAPFDTGGGASRTTNDYRYDENLSMDEYYKKAME